MNDANRNPTVLKMRRDIVALLTLAAKKLDEYDNNRLAMGACSAIVTAAHERRASSFSRFLAGRIVSEVYRNWSYSLFAPTTMVLEDVSNPYRASSYWLGPKTDRSIRVLRLLTLAAAVKAGDFDEILEKMIPYYRDYF
jgi:hypothetical protein